jgi:hypothetical protein
MDAAVQRVIEQQVLNVAKQLEDQIDSRIQKLENLDDEDIDRLRQKRIVELKKQQERTREWLANGHGEYREVMCEKDFFKEIKGEERVVCHFYRENWPCKVCGRSHPPPVSAQALRGSGPGRCPTRTRHGPERAALPGLQVVDKHLELLSKKHIETKFMRVSSVQDHSHHHRSAVVLPELCRSPIGAMPRAGSLAECLPSRSHLAHCRDHVRHLPAHACAPQINAEKSPFLTERLRIWMLPTLALVKHGKTVDYVVGFEDLGGKDDFSTQMLVDRLAAVEMVRPDAASKPKHQQQSTIKSGIYAHTGSDEDSDFDDC